MLTEYSAVMSGVITSGIPIPVPLLAALTAILAATIVYGVFYTKIVKKCSDVWATADSWHDKKAD